MHMHPNSFSYLCWYVYVNSFKSNANINKHFHQHPKIPLSTLLAAQCHNRDAQSDGLLDSDTSIIWYTYIHGRSLLSNNRLAVAWSDNMDYHIVLLLSLVAGSLAGELDTFYYHFSFICLTQNNYLLSLASEALQERKIKI